MLNYILSFSTAGVYPKPLWRLAAIGAVIWVLLASGCMFKDLRKDLKKGEITYVLFGRVKNIARAEGDVFVLLFAKRGDSWQLERFTLPDDTGATIRANRPGHGESRTKSWYMKVPRPRPAKQRCLIWL